tara:strand:+ start:426 stop:719 length:294 start_codon:yes stop_codon:yes gene_type:complete
MSRYNNTPIQRKDNVRIFSTTFYPKIPLQDSDKYVNVIVGTRLDNLAFQYYGDISLWWIIARANNLNGVEMRLDTTKTYRIPIDINSILEDFTKLNG